MSGHGGIAYFDARPIDPEIGGRLVFGLNDEGPDGGAEHREPGLFMAFRKFAFDELSRKEQQPYQSHAGNSITFDGRLDNREELRLLLAHRLPSPEAPADPVLALAAYEAWGRQGFNRLIGDWSLAIWDAGRQSTILASDYLGARPLFYFIGPEHAAWSSSLTQLVDWVGVYDDLDEAFIATYLTRNCGGNRTMYRGIRYVPCGSSIEIDRRGRASTEAFWALPTQTRLRYRDRTDYEEQLVHLFREAVAARLRTDQVVSCDLSGGLDSSSITCMAHHLIRSGQVSPARLVPVSVLAAEDEEDATYIDIVERHCGFKSVRLSCPCDLSLDQPPGPLPTWKLSMAAKVRQLRKQMSIRVSLTGFGGDDLMGNSLDEPGQVAEHLAHGHLLGWLGCGYRWARARRIPIWSILGRSVLPLLPARSQMRLWAIDPTPDDSYAHLAKMGMLNERFIERHLDFSGREQSFAYREATPAQRYFLYCFDRLRTYHGAGASPFALPVKSSHAFFHRPLFEFCATVPREELCAPGQTRDLMRRAFKGLLPPEVLRRRTKTTSRMTFETNLRELAPVLLSNPNGLLTEARGYVGYGRLTKAIRNPQAIDFRRSDLMPAVCLEVWLQARERHRLPARADAIKPPSRWLDANRNEYAVANQERR